MPFQPIFNEIEDDAQECAKRKIPNKTVLKRRLDESLVEKLASREGVCVCVGGG